MNVSILNISKVTETQLLAWYNTADEKRRNYINSAKTEKTKNSRIAADFLARKSVADFCGISEEEIRFFTNTHGKPYAVNAECCFNISHSGDYVLCAVADKEIGVDIEKTRPVHKNASKRFATEPEQEYISLDPVNFFKIWVLKEAYFKCIGTGLDSKIKDITFTVDGDNISSDKKGFSFSFLDAPEGYIAATCIKTEE